MSTTAKMIVAMNDNLDFANLDVMQTIVKETELVDFDVELEDTKLKLKYLNKFTKTDAAILPFGELPRSEKRELLLHIYKGLPVQVKLTADVWQDSTYIEDSHQYRFTPEKVIELKKVREDLVKRMHTQVPF